MNNFGPVQGGSTSTPHVLVPPRSRFRSPPLNFSDKIPILETNSEDEYINKRVAQFFAGKVIFGTMVERIRGPVLAKQADGTKLWQVVWKMVYDDEDTKQLNRLEIIAAMRSYQWNAKDDTRY